MSDTTTETPATEASEETRIERLESKVDRILDALPGLTGGKTREQIDHEQGARDAMLESPAADPKAEMRAELAKLQAAERRKAARDAEKQANEDRLKKIEEKLTEKPPREYKRSTKFMRWEDKPE